MPDPREGKAARCERSGWPGDRVLRERLDISNVTNPGRHQADARLALNELLANGARLVIVRRLGRADSFVREPCPGCDRARCREIIQSVKTRSPACWRAFLVAIAESNAPAP
jgi:hypothetical protein